MLAFVSGKIVQLSPAEVVIENNGIGYELKISLYTYEHLQGQESAQLHTYLHVRSDKQAVSGFELYGFSQPFEKQIFELLLSVSGIGANTARLMLSSMAPGEICRAILHENLPVIKGIKGVGPKTAQRLILELKDKVAKIDNSDTVNSGVSSNTTYEEALSALSALGIGKNVSEKAVKQAMEKQAGASLQEIIKEALKLI